MTWWSVVRFLHVMSAALWVGGQLTVTLVLLPPARRALSAGHRARLLNAVGRRFGVLTVAAFLPVQIGSGVAMAWHKGVTWASLGEPGYGRILAVKLLLFCAVMLAAGVHGWATGAGRPGFARAMALASLVGSVGVVLLATALPYT
ncbi:hypothetical protein [Sphaerisporangium fuscum]|uniref:hypothetical protein n=1 Tax=Sphaerisporangium fuscum TaxID=2835868 RepID=UPI001BDC3D42|nr:hypothetical protein [Sphaerisporangium fuscum]